jgi:hypothetical protein
MGKLNPVTLEDGGSVGRLVVLVLSGGEVGSSSTTVAVDVAAAISRVAVGVPVSIGIQVT